MPFEIEMLTPHRLKLHVCSSVDEFSKVLKKARTGDEESKQLLRKMTFRCSYCRSVLDAMSLTEDSGPQFEKIAQGFNDREST